MNIQKIFRNRVIAKAVYLTTFITLIATAAIGFALVPNFSVSSKAAQEKVAQNPGDEQATPEMLAFALNFKSAAGFQTLAAQSEDVSARTKKDLSDAFSAISQLPCTKIDGLQMNGKRFAPGVYCFDSAELAGQMTVDGENDFTSKFVFLIRGDFNTKSGAGIYLENGAQSANVFFVAENSVRIGEGIEFAGNLVAGKDIDVDDLSTVRGRMISVTGKVNKTVQNNLGGGFGTVQICKQTSQAGGTNISNRFYRFDVSGVAGTIEVFVPPTPATPAPGQLAGTSTGCSEPFDVPVGPQTITELTAARLPGQTVPTFTNFQLINVEQINPNQPTANVSSLGFANLAVRTAAINVVEGNQAGILVLRFTNQFAITGFIEICKQRASGPTLPIETFGFAAQTFNPSVGGTAPPSGGDSDLNGFFQYTIEGVYAQNQITSPGTAPAVNRSYQVFPVPVGACSGPIAVTVGNPLTTTSQAVVRVTELARPGFFLEKVTTRPTFDRETNDVLNTASAAVNAANGSGGEILGSRIVPPTNIVDTAPGNPIAPRGLIRDDNLGGGYATVRVLEGSTVLETIVDFYNRSNPGMVKVCKIAGPGIPEGTLFRFSVFGPFGTQVLGTPNSPQFSTYGPVSTIVDVAVGPASTGGNCVLVPGLGAGVNRGEFQTFVNGTPVLIVEHGISPLNTIPVPPGAIRTSRVRVLGPTLGTTLLPAGTGAGQAGFTPNPSLAVAPAGFDGRNLGNMIPVTTPRLSRAAFNQRPGEVTAEFVNFLFNPTILRICKVAGYGIPPNTRSFGFSVTFTNGGPTGAGGALFPGNPTANVSVVAGQATQSNPFGNCEAVDASAFPGGQINVGSDITITENGGIAGTIVTSITSSTSSGLNANTITRTARLSGSEGLIAGTTVVAFTNALGDDPNPIRRTRFDFDGDRKADPSVLTPSSGTWSYAASSAGYDIRSSLWGFSTDKPVPADYDGDGRYDIAIYRNGFWYVIGSAGSFIVIHFGTADDIPQPGDYDGDGKADAAVFRPSNGTWYMQGSRSGFSAVQFGVSSDKPIAADHDGDGKTDQTVYRVQNGRGFWYLNRSRDGFAGVNWGLASDIPVPSDYDGDGKTDVAVYRSGNWYILNENASFSHVNWGLASDIPVPADYNGDGKSDFAVYRNGNWYILETLPIRLGSEFDIPITGRQL